MMVGSVRNIVVVVVVVMALGTTTKAFQPIITTPRATTTAWRVSTTLPTLFVPTLSLGGAGGRGGGIRSGSTRSTRKTLSSLSSTSTTTTDTKDNNNNNNKTPKRKNDDDEEEEDATTEENDKKLNWNLISKQAAVFWEMAFPYYEESKTARWLFAGMIGMTLLNSAVSVAFSYLGKDFWNALSAKDTVEFYNVLTKYVGALLLGAPVVTLYKFQRERLAVHWREWMTDRTLQLYEDNRVYYALERGREVDNPDQRITEDVKSFTSYSLQLFLTIVTSIIDVISFSFILYSIYPQLFIAIAGYAAFGTITTTILGQDLVRLNYEALSKEADFRYSLVRLRDNAESIAFYSGEELEGRAIQARVKAVIANAREIIGTQRNLEFFTNGYRFMIQLLPVAVVAPRYFAGAIELGVISQSVGAFNHILSDLSIIVNQFEQLSRFSAGIERLSIFLNAMRTMDSKRDESYSLLQMAGSKNETTTTTNIIMGTDDDTAIDTSTTPTTATTTNGSTRSNFSLFGNKIDLRQMAPVVPLEDGFLAPSNHPILTLDHVDLCTPDLKRVLIRDLNLQLSEGNNLLIVGNSGAGKSSLLRGIAGLWSDGNGMIERPCDPDVYFLPQRPYCALGSLKDQLLYPSLDNSADTDDYPEGHVFSRSHFLRQSLTDEDLLEVLNKVDLGQLAGRAGDGDPIKGLQQVLDWSNTLSLGEQQRLAFGRVLVNQPRLVILDEATSALDMVAEAKMYTLLRNLAKKEMTKGGAMSAPGLTYISVGHRPSLLAYHDLRLRLGGDEDHSLEVIEKSSLDLKKAVSNL
jgi:vitamin B12/bleomycin/antimicrobial peptide transport system ATP-binding/permease protein